MLGESASTYAVLRVANLKAIVIARSVTQRAVQRSACGNKPVAVPV